MRVIYSNQAIKFLEKQTVSSRQRIINAIYKLPKEGDIKKLEGESGKRLRVGIYRVIFDEKNDVVFIRRIKTRGDVYKGGKRK